MSALFRHVVYPAYHWAKRDGVNRARRELEKNQWLPSEQLLALQKKKLARLLSFAQRNVPYYKSLFSGLGLRMSETIGQGEFQQIPTLTKDIIRREQDSLVSEDLSGNRLFPNSTSGSTGDPIRFFTDFRSITCRKAADIRSDSWTGWRLGDRYASLWGAPMDEVLATRLRGKIHAVVTNRRFLSSFDLSASRMDEYIEILRNFRPVFFLAYPGPLEQFAIHCKKRNVFFPSIKGIVSSAETLWPHQREIVEEVFGIKVFNRYGSREIGLIGNECEAHDGLHIITDRVVVEVVNEDGHPCAPGEIGRILVTDLDNYGMPMIRYDIGDRAVPSENRLCDCGRGFPLIDRIEGRTLEVVRTPDGRRIGGTFWTLLLRSRPGLKQFQVVQPALDSVQVRFVRGDDFSEATIDAFVTKIQETCGGEVSVDFIEVDSIDLTESGKQRLIISRVSNRSEDMNPVDC